MLEDPRDHQGDQGELDRRPADRDEGVAADVDPGRGQHREDDPDQDDQRERDPPGRGDRHQAAITATPRAAAPRQSSTEPTALTVARRTSPAWIRRTVSTIAVENVVYPPQNPVAATASHGRAEPVVEVRAVEQADQQRARRR